MEEEEKNGEEEKSDSRRITTMTKEISIHWFRQDLRLSDNPALTKAAEHEAVLPIYILDDENPGNHAMGGASRWWPVVLGYRLRYNFRRPGEQVRQGRVVRVRRGRPRSLEA